MKYLVWYEALIEKARWRDIQSPYTEVHHIKPKSMGGGNEPANLVRLTYREHFLAHWLLTKICVGSDLRKMQRALFAMTLLCSRERIVASWQFEIAKRAVKDMHLSNALRAAAERAHEIARQREMGQYAASLPAKWKERSADTKIVLANARKADLVAKEQRRALAPQGRRRFYLRRHFPSASSTRDSQSGGAQ
jgi:hypothetical protein